MKFKVITLAVAVILLSVFMAGCGTTPEKPAYSDALTDKVLTAINEGDYEKFSQDLDDKMKELLTETAFTNLKSQLAASAGDYVSKEFEKITVTGDYTTVVYNAKYTKAEKVVITISFSTVDGKNLVSGLYFK
jgi:major membrane immunogen (membrane-anchored lipoprotein)